MEVAPRDERVLAQLSRFAEGFVQPFALEFAQDRQELREIKVEVPARRLHSRVDAGHDDFIAALVPEHMLEGANDRVLADHAVLGRHWDPSVLALRPTTQFRVVPCLRVPEASFIRRSLSSRARYCKETV